MTAGTLARQPRAGLAKALGVGVAAGLVASVANVAISAIARGPFGASSDFVPLAPGAIVMWTMLGAVIGAVGWRFVTSRRLLTGLVPAVLALSLVPDVLLLVTDETPGQTTAGVVALMLMHVVTTAIVVTAYARALPPSD